jgi:hypothetical protein
MKEKEDKKMKEKNYSKKLAYMGAGCGVVLFAVFGLLPGLYIGGVMGLNIAGTIMGSPVTSGLISRLIVGASVIVGIMVSGIMFVTTSSTAGWLIGSAIDAIRAEKKELTPVEHK